MSDPEVIKLVAKAREDIAAGRALTVKKAEGKKNPQRSQGN